MPVPGTVRRIAFRAPSPCMETKPQTMSGSSLCRAPSRLLKPMAQAYPCRRSGATSRPPSARASIREGPRCRR